MKKNTATESVNLFWTGGWDSTFRLLQLLLNEKKQVQPYYLKFPSQKTPGKNGIVRKSTIKEIETMDKIKEKLFKDYPFTKELLLPTIYVETDSIKPNRKITDAYHKIRSDKYIGGQYVKLAGFANKYGIHDLELSIERIGHSHEVIKPYITKSDYSSGIYVIDADTATEPVYTLYKNFSFPLLKYSKSEMAEISKRENWTDFMKMTWFCHSPYFGKYPCGSCNPCISSYENEMEWRLPLFSRLFGRILKKWYHSKLFTKFRALF